MDCNIILNKLLWCPEDEPLMTPVIPWLFLYCQREFKCVSSFSSGPTLLFTREETFAGGCSICSGCLWFLTRSIKRSAPGVGKLEQISVTSVRPTDAFKRLYSFSSKTVGISFWINHCKLKVMAVSMQLLFSPYMCPVNFTLCFGPMSVHMRPITLTFKWIFCKSLRYSQADYSMLRNYGEKRYRGFFYSTWLEGNSFFIIIIIFTIWQRRPHLNC